MTVMSFKTRTGCSLWTFQVFSQQQGAAQGRDDRFVIADLYAVHAGTGSQFETHDSFFAVADLTRFIEKSSSDYAGVDRRRRKEDGVIHPQGPASGGLCGGLDTPWR